MIETNNKDLAKESKQVPKPKNQIINKPLKLETVNEGNNEDDVLVRGADKTVKFVSRNAFQTGGNQNLDQTLTNGNRSSSPIAIGVENNQEVFISDYSITAATGEYDAAAVVSSFGLVTNRQIDDNNKTDSSFSADHLYFNLNDGNERQASLGYHNGLFLKMGGKAFTLTSEGNTEALTLQTPNYGGMEVLPISVNGNFADANGNIEINSESGDLTLEQVLHNGSVATGVPPIILKGANGDHAEALLAAQQFNMVFDSNNPLLQRIIINPAYVQIEGNGKSTITDKDYLTGTTNFNGSTTTQNKLELTNREAPGTASYSFNKTKPAGTYTIATSDDISTATQAALENVLHKTGYTSETKTGELVIDSGTNSDSGLKLAKLPSSSNFSSQTYSSGYTNVYSNLLLPNGEMLVTVVGDATIYKLPVGGGAPVPYSTGFNYPYAMVLLSTGEVLVADAGKSSVMKIPADGGSPTTFSSGFGFNPQGLTKLPSGEILIADRNFDNGMWKIPATGGTATFFNSTIGNAMSISTLSNGDVLYCRSSDNKIYKIPSGGGTPTVYATLPYGAAQVRVFANDRVIVTYSGLYSVAEIAPNGSLTQLSGQISNPGGIEILPNGDLILCAYNSIQKIIPPLAKVLRTDNTGKIVNTTYLEDVQYVKATDLDLSNYAKLNSPAFNGVPTAPTAPNGTNTNQIATTAFVLANTSTDTEDNVKLNGNQTIQGNKTFTESVSGKIGSLPNHYITKSQLDAYLPLTGGLITGFLSFLEYVTFNKDIELNPGSGLYKTTQEGMAPPRLVAGITEEGKVFGQQFNVGMLSVHENNASAIEGELSPGDFYRTSTGVLMVVF